uniref:Uncharacterized protein n=1 Tax=Anguilla anguilla TaxID=7936 RepID=A0A0E9Q741_ANGAN
MDMYYDTHIHIYKQISTVSKFFLVLLRFGPLRKNKSHETRSRNGIHKF